MKIFLGFIDVAGGWLRAALHGRKDKQKPYKGDKETPGNETTQALSMRQPCPQVALGRRAAAREGLSAPPGALLRSGTWHEPACRWGWEGGTPLIGGEPRESQRRMRPAAPGSLLGEGQHPPHPPLLQEERRGLWVEMQVQVMLGKGENSCKIILPSQGNLR